MHLNLIACGRVLARKRRAEQVDVEDLRRAYTYFMDEKRSVQWLKEQQGSLVFEEIGVDSDGRGYGNGLSGELSSHGLIA
jgi:RuvB-like protein 2